MLTLSPLLGQEGYNQIFQGICKEDMFCEFVSLNLNCCSFIFTITYQLSSLNRKNTDFLFY